MQPDLFELSRVHVEDERLVLCALGEFQARKLELVDRLLPLDRVRGAMRRAAEILNAEELTDEEFAVTLERLGAAVKRVPAFVAKHPFRVTINETLAERARIVYTEVASEIEK